MTEHQIRIQLHAILDTHDQALLAIQAARTGITKTATAIDDAVVSAIEANRAAIAMLNRIMNEGVQADE